MQLHTALASSKAIQSTPMLHESTTPWPIPARRPYMNAKASSSLPTAELGLSCDGLRKKCTRIRPAAQVPCRLVMGGSRREWPVGRLGSLSWEEELLVCESKLVEMAEAVGRPWQN